jgi:PEP-CTERM motif
MIRTRSILLATALAVSGMFMATGARADLLAFNWANGTDWASWTQDSNPTPFSSSAGTSTTISVTDGMSDLGAISLVTFFATGGFSSDVLGISDLTGGQIYTGSEASPSFAIGTYAGGDLQVPEPLSTAVLGSGLVGLFLARRRKV